MYDLKPYKYVRGNPWDVPVEYRISKTTKMKDIGFKIVTYLYEKPDSGTFRYRVYNMCQSLEYSILWRGIYFFEEELEYAKNFLKKTDILIIVRYKWTKELGDIINECKKNNIKIVFDIDDLIYNPKYLPIIVDTLSVRFDFEQAYKEWFQLSSRLQYTAELCDILISTNEFIGKYLEKDFNKKSYIIYNFFNREQELASEYLREQKNSSNINDIFTIGYFSGTATHKKDFDMIANQLLELLNENKDMKLIIVGELELPNYMDKLIKSERIKKVPLQNFIDLQYQIARVDVNIIPLIDNIFTNCKSELKFFEAGIVNTITCASPRYVYNNIIKNHINGFIAGDKDWGKVLFEIYKNKNKIQVANTAKIDSYNRYSYLYQTNIIEHVLDQIKG